MLLDDPGEYRAKAIRDYVLVRADIASADRIKNMTSAIRGFLRFLIATGRCPSGLDYAIPRAANWQLAPLPRFLSEADVERLIASCVGERWLRDRAIILLLARLGLRASEVARLSFDDIDWRQGIIRVLGKNRKEELLPLSQEPGDAIIAYIEGARPATRLQAIFLTEYAPLRPISRITVKCLVKRALDRGGIDCPYKGAHILRHTAATTMLRHGVSLRDIGDVLRHRGTAITAHYAKVDISLLAGIAQPWRGGSSC